MWNRFTRFFSLGIFLAIVMASCAGAPPAQVAGAPISTAPSSPLPMTMPVAEAPRVDLSFMSEEQVRDAWGASWEVNPFLPQVKMFAGKQFEIFVLRLDPSGNLAATVLRVEAFGQGGTSVGRTYEKSAFVDFWLARTGDEDKEWAKKQRLIERYVPYYGSAFPMYAGKEYLLVLVLPKDSPAPVRYEVELIVNDAQVLLSWPKE